MSHANIVSCHICKIQQHQNLMTEAMCNNEKVYICQKHTVKKPSNGVRSRALKKTGRKGKRR